jgi:hypothetical protein
LSDLAGDLLVIVPSRGRPQNIARLLDAVHATAKMRTHVHVAVDDDDPELERYQYVIGQAAGDGDRLTAGPRKGLAAWTNEIAVARAGEYPFLASLGDDHVPYTPGWDRALIRAIAGMGGTGFAYPWDGTREDIPEAVVMSSDIVAALGWMCLPGLSHWYVDNVWADLGRGAGCLRHLRAVKVEHAWKGDQTSRESSEALTADRDAYYAWRRSQRMEQDTGTVIGLREASVLQPA